MASVYRHKFASTTIEHMDYFAKLHKDDDRKTFKEAWERWTNNNNEMIEMEKRLHSESGYKGDVIDKMYKSVRYYYRKKVVSVIENKEQQRRDYVALDRELLREMNEHVSLNKSIKPAIAFDNFCEINQELIKIEALRLKEYLKVDEIGEKIKKTYKNRHFNTINSEKE